MIEKILVAVDGSPESVKAVSFACDLAAKGDAEIVLLHVLLRGHMPDGLRKAIEVEVGTRSQDGSGHLVNMPQEIMARVKDKKTTQLSLEQLDIIGNYVLAKVSELCRERGVQGVTKRVEEGNPAKVILDVAESSRADVIVMGGRGLGDLKGILLGSVSQKVTQLSRCTCVTVK